MPNIPYNTLTETDVLPLLDGAVILERDTHGPKIYELTNGQMLKLFRIRRRLSSNLWSPYAKRFARNSIRLVEHHIQTVKVTQWGRIPHLDRQYVLYDKLVGETLRDSDAWTNDQLGRFMAALHHRGIYFRSCHLGNILCLPEGNFGLIDIMDLKVYRRALSDSHRQRNFRHLRRLAKDRERLDSDWEAFLQAYSKQRETCEKV